MKKDDRGQSISNAGLSALVAPKALRSRAVPAGRSVPIGLLLMIFWGIFDVMLVLGYLYPWWMRNGLCFRLLGCNDGFFGYDAYLHFVSGMVQAAFVLWLAYRVPRWNFFGKGYVRNLFVLVATVALISVLWELGEFLHDHYALYIAHLNVYHLDDALQPTNSDTVGDMIFGISGGLLAGLLVRYFNPRRLYDPSSDASGTH